MILAAWKSLSVIVSIHFNIFLACVEGSNKWIGALAKDLQSSQNQVESAQKVGNPHHEVLVLIKESLESSESLLELIWLSGAGALGEWASGVPPKNDELQLQNLPSGNLTNTFNDSIKHMKIIYKLFWGIFIGLSVGLGLASSGLDPVKVSV